MQIELGALAHFVGIAVRRKQGSGFIGVQPHLPRHARQHLMAGGAQAVRKIGLEQCMLEGGLQALFLGPVQQPVCIEGVVDAAAFVHAEGEPQLRATGGDGVAVALALLGRGAIFFKQMLGNVLPLRAHLRVELEGLKVQVDRDLIFHALGGLLQGLEANHTPGAGNIGNKIDLQGLERHGGKLAEKVQPPMVDPCSRVCRPHESVPFPLCGQDRL